MNFFARLGSPQYEPPFIPPPRNPTYDLQATISGQHYESQKLQSDNESRSRLQSLDYEIATLRAEEEILEARIAAIRSTPSHFWMATSVLAYLAVVGIVVPLFLIPAPISEPLPQWERWLVVGGFALGLLASLVLLVVQMLRSRKVDDVKSAA